MTDRKPGLSRRDFVRLGLVVPASLAAACGWDGAYGTHFWVDQKEDLIAVLMIQTPVRDIRPEFENAVMQSIIK